jgi:5,5'-dehydrodivanillate O-demethylase
MLSDADNEKLVRVGPATPSGRLLREYWHPVFCSADLAAPGSVLSFELLGERLVAYRDLAGEVRVVTERCPHRGASLAYGYVEPDGLRCAYHGWLFDSAGRCIERPFETAAPSARCHLPPYRAREHAGLVFVSLHPEGPPPFPLWDILARTDGGFRIDLQEDIACNWLQVQENAADVTHTVYLHSRAFAEQGIADPTGFSLPLVEFGFQPFQYGIIKSWTYEGSDGGELHGWGNPLVFPTMMRIETEMHWRVPIDETTTRVIILSFDPAGQGVSINRLPERRDPDKRYTMRDFYSQDAMAWETQGAIADRTTETLGASDIGISMYRQMLASAIDACERGEPVPAQGNRVPSRGHPDVIDLRTWMNGYLPMSAPHDPTPTERLEQHHVFDKRHRRHRLAQVAAGSTPSTDASVTAAAAGAPEVQLGRTQ